MNIRQDPELTILYVFTIQQVLVNVLKKLIDTESFAQDFSYELGEVQLFCYN